MSYILDALKRAEAERERERQAVPGLFSAHAPLAADAEEHEEPDTVASLWPVWLIGAGILAAAIAGTWYLARGSAAGDSATTAANPAPLASTASAPTTVAPPAGISIETAPSSRGTPAPTPGPTMRQARPLPLVEVIEAQAPPVNKPAAKTASSAGTASPSTELTPIYTRGTLPEPARHELPALTVGGAMYSEQANQRMLVINGQVVHEGSTVAPDVVLEQIRLKSAILRFRGHRLEITY